MKKILTFIFFLSISLVCFSQAEFITTWQTTVNGESITIPTTGGGYNYNVDWGDSSSDTGVTGNISHTYTTAGIYTVIITGTFRRIFFDGSTPGTAPNRDKILSIEQWGAGRNWSSMFKAFEGCSNLVNNASDIPDLSSATSLQRMFRDATSIGGLSDSGNWAWGSNTSTILNMSQLFRGATSFNKDISGWDTSATNNMSLMFRDAVVFNQNIGGWTTTNVTRMNSMFYGATNFNQNINGWDVSAVTTMSSMFREASSFNQDLNGWITTDLNTTSTMFRDATSFDGNINSWNVSLVTTMANMFYGATAFNQDLNSWTPIIVGSMANMFRDATSFNGNISSWNVSSVTSMGSMFRGASSFNQDISSWTPLMVTTMAAMFRDASDFNQNISGWNVSSVTNLGSMFRNCPDFDQNLGGWDVSGVTNFNNMLSGSKLSVENYNALLVGWNTLTLQPNETPHFGTSRYCSPAAIAAKANIETTFSWTFSDGGELTTYVWTGDTDTEWNTSSNWQDGYSSDCELDISIPVVTNYPVINSTSEINVNNLTIDSGASLTINGGLTVGGNLTTNDGLTLNSGGSIIVNGTSTGDLTYNRNLPTGNDWYYVSSPLQGETIDNYIANNPLNTGSGNTGLFYYDNNTTSGFAGSGFIFYTPASVGSFTDAKGYGTQINAAGDVTFTGTMPTSDISISISEGTMGDINPNPSNLIGNPFPSYVAANTNADANNILSNNTSILSEETIWLWDNSINDYTTINNMSAAFFLAPGQGFFVSSTSSGGTFNFLEAWQSHQETEVFYKNSTPNPNTIKLELTNTQNQRRFTEIYFVNNKTVNFDNGYDSRKLSEDNNLNLFTRLVANENSDDFAIQTLPTQNIESFSIPLGVVANTAFTIKLSEVNLPTGFSVFIEDKLKNTFTKLDQKTPFNLAIKDKVEGVGRFYLHAKTSVLKVEDETILKNHFYITANKSLVFEGLSTQKNAVEIYDILGKKVVSTSVNATNNYVKLSALKRGIYVVKLKTEKGTLNKKVFLD